MAFTLPELPYAKDALAPHVSAETLNYHHGKHHAGYVKKLNAAAEGTRFANMALTELIHRIDEAPADKRAAFFNSGCQHYNHSFYWSCMTPNDSQPSRVLSAAIDTKWGSFGALQAAFAKEAGSHFGSGWAWLVKGADGGLDITSTHDADTPLAHGQAPLLTCDVWEHAYYIDYRNARGDYIAAFWNLVNWDFVSENFDR